MQFVHRLFIAACLAVPLPLVAQTVAPREVITSAVESVEALGKKVVLGEHKAAIDSMYPQWKQRMAKRKGGIEKLEEELGSIGAAMARQGVSIISVKTEGVPRVYDVWPGKPDEDAAEDAEPVYTKWMVLVPTVTRFRIMQGDNPKPHVIDSHGFQVAISDKDKLEWTFINGSDITIPDLRGLFASLPANMELPLVKREVVE